VARLDGEAEARERHREVLVSAQGVLGTARRAGAAEAVLPGGRADVPCLLDRARSAAEAAQGFLFRIQRGDHWCAELESNTTITAEYVLLCQALGLDLAGRKDAIARYLFSRQKGDGSWGIAHNHPGEG
jgi:hypothetical protein